NVYGRTYASLLVLKSTDFNTDNEGSKRSAEGSTTILHEKEDLRLYSYVYDNYEYKKEVHQMKDIITSLTMKELEQITYRALHNSFSQVMAQILQVRDEARVSGR